jgi:rhodanese-related sulfurtransferase
VAAAEAHAARWAAEDGVRYLDVAALEGMVERGSQETVYLVDVRAREEYLAGHIPGFHWFPGGQAVQRSDEVAVVKHASIVFACDRRARASVTASWYRQMGFEQVYAVDGGTTAWVASGRALETGPADVRPVVYATARSTLTLVSAPQVHASPPSAAIFVDTSQDFARGHVPGARWVPRGWLEFWIADSVPSKTTDVLVTCHDGGNSVLAGATLRALGYERVSVLDGGMEAWRRAGLPVEQGLSGVMAAPTDVVPAGPDRNFADMQNYLRWEEALGYKYAPASRT